MAEIEKNYKGIMRAEYGALDNVKRWGNGRICIYRQRKKDEAVLN